MTTHIPYEPPEHDRGDGFVALDVVTGDTRTDYFLAVTPPRFARGWAVQIDPDPLGPINRIVSLMRGRQRVRSVLCPVPVGATVRLVRDEGAWTLRNVFALRDRLWDSRGSGEPEPSLDIRPPGWRIEVNERTVLTVTDSEMHTPAPPPPPAPLWRRMRQAFREQLRADADSIAKRLGYHREDECGGDW